MRLQLSPCQPVAGEVGKSKATGLPQRRKFSVLTLQCGRLGVIFYAHVDNDSIKTGLLYLAQDYNYVTLLRTLRVFDAF